MQVCTLKSSLMRHLSFNLVFVVAYMERHRPIHCGSNTDNTAQSLFFTTPGYCSLNAGGDGVESTSDFVIQNCQTLYSM